jgi:3-hydroxyacyl-CoA dehydrogenase
MSVVTVSRTSDIAWVTIDNPPVNATSTRVRAGLLSAVEEVKGARIAVLRGAGSHFVAGGDMSEFDQPPMPPDLPDVVDAIENSPTPFLAALHGNVLGGGFEIAMACAWRIAAPGTRFGLPEVNVGLIPGAGGSQRAPRLLGWDAAIDMACNGQILTAEALLALGAVDAIDADIEGAARRFDRERPVPVSARSVPPMEPEWFAEKQISLRNRARGRKAPEHNLEALTWANLPYTEGQPKERALHLELRKSDESTALRHVFFAERKVSRPAIIKDVATCELSCVAIVGGGLMGAGIAASILSAGLRVDLIERDAQAADAAHVRVRDLIAGALRRGKINQTDYDAQIAAFAVHTDYAAAKDADLAIEAVFEHVAAKQDVFAQLAAVVRSDAILATNTSYLDPSVIFDGIAGQERCIGLHFFSPAHIMKLLEVVMLPDTSPEVIATAFKLGKQLRKVAVLSGICDGFIGNRMLAAYRRAAEYMLADGALPQQIDKAMRSFGMAMGPFEVQDLSGLQIAEANRRRADATRDPAERYVTIADQLCAMGRTGKRDGKGWYHYVEGSRVGQPDPAVEKVILDYAAQQNIKRRRFDDAEIQIQLLAVLANEGARIVEEGIAENDAAVDIVKVHGYGFPRWRGGPLWAARTMGDDKIKTALGVLEDASPDTWVRAQRFTS